MALEIKKVEQCPLFDLKKLVKVTEMGNIIQVQYMSNRNTKQVIQMLPGGDEYVEISTGEVKKVTHHETRVTQIKELLKTFSKIRALINTNITDVNCVRWITLTYAENMTCTKRLKTDFNSFNKRFMRYCDNKGYKKPEYITVCEPQGRGAWHHHLLYIWDSEAPFIPNKELRAIWKQGFVKITKLDDVDNVGAYLTAYLGNMEIQEANEEGLIHNGAKCKKVEISNNEGIKQSKAFIKGARLGLYPANFNIYRNSKGIKRPVEYMTSQKKANAKVSDGTLTYEKTCILSDVENNFESVINQRQYNMVRKKSK